MDYSIYIIKQNTPESKILPHSGLNRKDLVINKWKGRKKINGGFGKAPVEWKIEGIQNVKLLCETVVRILKKRKNLNDEELQAFNRALKTLEGIKNNCEKERRNEALNEKKKIKIIALFEFLYPSIEKNRIANFAKEKSNNKFSSLDNLMENFKHELYEVPAIEEARSKFNELMRPMD
jgi:hypothetical protein